MNLFDKDSPVGLVIVCQCGVEDFTTIEEAQAAGWTGLIKDIDGDGFGWDYIGVCPECVEIAERKSNLLDIERLRG